MIRALVTGATGFIGRALCAGASGWQISAVDQRKPGWEAALDGQEVVVHLAGAAFALAYYKLHWRVLDWLPDLRRRLSRTERPSLRVYRPEEKEPVAVAAAKGPAAMDEHLEAKVDAVLEKVAKSGQASLNDAERRILLRASEIYKRKRT